jgi:FHA domain-containing protein
MRKRRPDTIMSSEAEEEPVSVLQRFEKRLEGLVEGAFAKVFKGVVHPVEILNAMQREAEAHKAILAGGRTLVPNRYVIDLSPYDHSRLAPYAAALAQELAQSQAEFIGEQAWTVYGDVIVEIERGEGLDTGMFRVTAEVYTGGEVAPVQQPAYDAGPQYSPYDQGGYQQPGGPNGRNVGLVSGDGRNYPLQMGSTVIGRGDQANLRLPDVGISRRHARLDYDGNQVVLTDLGSTNGTMVNGQRVSAVALNPGDMIQLGTTTLTFRVDG